MAKQLTLLIVLFTINCFFGVDCFGSIEDDKIKREGNQYDNNSEVVNTSDWFDEWAASRRSRLGKEAEVPLFASPKYADYGNSKYDTGLTYLNEFSNAAGSLENMRSEKQREEVNSITKNTLLGIGVFGLIFGLIYSTKKMENNETNKE